MSGQPNERNHGFSLIELVIVVVILAIIAAIAIPRMSRGAAGAQDSTLSSNLRLLRAAIELYATEHGGTYPTEANIASQLTQYSDEAGNTAAAKDAATGKIYGPYLRQVPPLPVNCKMKGQSGIANVGTGATTGWVYTVNASGIGTIKANTTVEADAKNVLYNSY